MKLIVTDLILHTEINDATYVVTTKGDIAKKYKNAILINIAQKITSEEVEKILNKINYCIMDIIGTDEKMQMLWYMTDCHGESTSRMIINLYNIIKQCYILEDIDIEQAELYYSMSNRQVCEVIRNFLINQKISFLSNYDELSARDRVAYLVRHSVRGGDYAYFNFKSIFSVIQLIRYSFFHLRKPKRVEYDFGMAICSDGIRIYNWLLGDINSISQFEYKILCMGANKTYYRLKKSGICADRMEEWVELKEVRRKFKEFFKLRRLIKENFRDKYKFIYQRMDYSMVMREYLVEYLYREMMGRYEMHIICASYFKYNSFKAIEPWCISSYPQTRIFYINKNRERFCRYYPFQYTPYRSKEKWPEIFDIAFFSPIGYDVRGDFIKSCPNVESYYHNLKDEYLYREWVKNKREEKWQEYKKKITILYAVPGTDYNRQIYDIISKVEQFLENVKETSWQVLCKFHPEDGKKESVIELAKRYEAFNNILFLDSSEGIEKNIEQADLIITGISTTILDGISARKPILIYLAEEEKKSISYLDNIVEIYTDIKSLNMCLEKIMNIDYFYQWRRERIEKQDEFFSENQKCVVNRWQKLKEFINE